MTEYRLLIDGRLVAGDMTMEVVNPANEQVLALAPRASGAQLDAAVTAAKAAFPAWAARPIEDRRVLILGIADPEPRDVGDEISGTRSHVSPFIVAEILRGSGGWPPARPQIQRPPSTSSATPVTIDASSEQR